ncbi:uncharacterized protein LOC144142123 [Haemaphysalis longicornis]
MMATGGVPGSGFKPETIQFVIATIQDFWHDRSQEKLGELFGYFKLNGMTCEADVLTMDEEDLEELIGDEPARIILEHFIKRSANNSHSKPAPGGRRDHKSKGSARQSDGADDSRSSEQPTAGDQNQMGQMFQMFLAVQQSEGEKNRQMMDVLQTRMENALERVTSNIMATVNNMNDKLTSQMELQRDLLERMGGSIVAMEQRHQEQAARTQEWMESTQRMNNEMVKELTRKVNEGLQANEDRMDEMRREFGRREWIPPESLSPRCPIL